MTLVLSLFVFVGVTFPETHIGVVSKSNLSRPTPNTHDRFELGLSCGAESLNYMKGRFQLPTYAKFNRPDPMRDWNWLAPHTINLYEYVGNDPINAWDPDGHSGEGPVRDTLTILKSAWDSFWHSAGEAVAAPLIAATYTFFAIIEDVNQRSEDESTIG